MYETYGAKFTLYAFAMSSDFLISEIPCEYAVEFAESKDWLRFGYHGKCGATAFRDECGFRQGYRLVDDTLSRLNTGKTDVLRLHSWYATSEQKQYLYENGVTQLLFPDIDELYENGESFTEDGILHHRTRVWFEKMSLMTADTLLVGKENVYAFTHEKHFEGQTDNIEKAIALYKQADYLFI
ncbi:MAG: hypothetical protein FWH17_03445 [Oscillospiraceae bacterium]|nr:hypothetical protein [Oscillospiraceae bacterium]